MADSFREYESEGHKMDFFSAVNLTSILGDKGGSTRQSFFDCNNIQNAGNILSVTFAPKVNAGTIYAAWEKGFNATWRPACCGTYLQFDMQPWW